jgi:hypothetical protein
MKIRNTIVHVPSLSDLEELYKSNGLEPMSLRFIDELSAATAAYLKATEEQIQKRKEKERLIAEGNRCFVYALAAPTNI